MKGPRPAGQVQLPSLREIELELCRRSFLYFLSHHCWVLSESGGEGVWIKFDPWPAQVQVAGELEAQRLVILLKARQLGMTWLVLAFVLWLVLFRPIATVLLFSKRDDEAVDLLKVRLRGMYNRLPDWMRLKPKRGLADNDHEWQLANGSRVLAFPTTGGDSYTATLAVVDEADLVPNLASLMAAVKPTIDGGGRMILLSRPDKSQPLSVFKKMYLAAKRKLTDWLAIFLPWSARPGRDSAWYEAQKKDIEQRTGSLDDLHEQYPETDAQALSPRTLDKRIPGPWLQQCFDGEVKPLELSGIPGTPAVPGLVVYRLPVPGRKYGCGADPAQGNPNSDDSAALWLDMDSGEEVARLAGKLEMTLFGGYVGQVCTWYNHAPALVESNNHGHTVIKHLRERFPRIRLLTGHLRTQVGWVSSGLGKAILYDTAADAFKNREVTIHSLEVFTQLASIDGQTLLAPTGQPDDLADAAALAIAARPRSRPMIYMPSE